jgi:anti-sigma-28 factor FlgM
MNLPAKGGSPSHGERDRPTTPQPDRVTRLKQQVALGRYSVDADAVAREMLFKLRVLSLSRRALLAGRAGAGGRQAGPSPQE